MIYTADPHLDAIRAKYKAEYDANFVQIKDSRDCPKLRAKLQATERRLHNRTAMFLKKNAHYFTAKRRAIMRKIDSEIGADYETAPERDENDPLKEPDGRSRNRFIMNRWGAV